MKNLNGLVGLDVSFTCRGGWKKVDHENRVPLFGLVCVGCANLWAWLFGLILGFGHG